ncbi:MAG TPA: hypothetical protein VFX60_05965 [Micromonospora sp.]|nr:hypothetical protein [Micromonospora sp.]
MRLTVGPLPPAVYWRRRALVLGAVLLFVWVVAYSCSGTGKTAANSGLTSSPEPTVTVHTPTSDPPSSDAPGEESTGEGSTGGGSTSTEPAEGAPVDPGAGSAPGAGTCTDEEIRVTPAPEFNPVQRGVTIELRLKIKNVSNRTCDRDLGADAQEIYIALGAEQVWSSDTCGTASGTDVKALQPGVEHEYRVAWNGKASTSCAKGIATGDPLTAGEYQLFGRLGTKLSEPVKLTITD